jgi:hypothetical protein
LILRAIGIAVNAVLHRKSKAYTIKTTGRRSQLRCRTFTACYGHACQEQPLRCASRTFRHKHTLLSSPLAARL